MRRYSKKSGVTKSYRKKGPTFKKTKKVAASSAGKRLKTLVDGAVHKALSAGAQNERRKVTMELVLPDRSIYINGKKSLLNCLRLPITDAIPAQSGAGQGSDVRRRRSNKIVVTGVSVRASLAVLDETRLMVFPYEPHESVRAHLRKTSLAMEPNPRNGEVPEKFSTVRQTHYALGMVSKHGPLMTKKSGTDIALDTADGTPFECRLSTHAGKPIGMVQRKKYGAGNLRRTQNWDQPGSKNVVAGFTSWPTHTFNEYWKLNKEYTYMHEGLNEQVFDRGAELFMYADCPSLQSKEIQEEDEVEGAVLRSVIVDIYYHDM